jgi:membrane-associated phospholipid phosphatase
VKFQFVFNRFLFVFFFICSGIFCQAQNWDIDLLRKINLHRNRSLDNFFIIITDYAAPLAYSIPLFILVYALYKKNKVLKYKSFFIIQSTVMVLVVATVLKHLINRPRPFVTYPFIEKMSTGSSPSFPSGHTSDAFTLAISLSIAFPRWYVIFPSFLWAITVGYSRVHLGVHYPSDIMASVFIAILSSGLIWNLFKYERLVRKKTLPA